jgi:hypothetical protein
MRTSKAITAVLALATLTLPATASAQSFLQSLFGFGDGPKPPASTPLRNNGRVQPATPQSSSPATSPNRPEQSQSDGGGGKFRTVCVRMCDGYYFPISNVSRRRDFYRDAKVCSAKCGEEGKLFYQSSSDENMSELVDLQGRNYAKLPNAFVYRKKLIDGCSCKPMPWSEAELARHRQYAAEEAAKVKVAAATAADVAAPATAAATAAAPAAAPPAVVAGANAAPPAPERQGEIKQALALPEPEPSDTDRGSVANPPPAEPEPVTLAPPRTERPRGDTSRQRPPARQAPARVTPAAAQPSPSGFSIFGGSGQSKYTWPGDAPQRPR